MEIDITRMSSKGQVVIPADMRKTLKAGDKLILIKEKDRIIMKKASKTEENFIEDLEFARRTEEAWKEIGKGKSKRVSLEEFEKELASW